MALSGFISRQFAHPSGVGGRLVTLVGSRQNRGLYEAALHLLAATDADRVLDIGCGNGTVLGLLAARCRAALAGGDPSPAMVSAATARNAAHIRAGRMTITPGDAAHLGFPDHTFSKALSVNTVYFWADVDQAMAEIRRVLAPGGVFVNALYTNKTLGGLSHTGSGYRFHDPDDLVSGAERAGFSARVAPVLDGAAYCLVCRVIPPGK